MWILIDNDDSFAFMLFDYLRRFHEDIKLIHIHSGISAEEIIAMNPERLIISPGPGKPADANLSNELVAYFIDKIPILGVCLGHQILGVFLGAQCVASGQPLHGKTSQLKILHEHFVFDGLDPSTIQIMHYHSLIVSHYQNTELLPLAVDEHNYLMACTHSKFPILGLQFHPESVLTPDGNRMIQNWCSHQFLDRKV